MSIKNDVAAVLVHTKNVNNGVTIDHLFDLINAGNLDTPILSRDQIRRAINTIPFAQKIDKYTWRIKGRATPKSSLTAS